MDLENTGVADEFQQSADAGQTMSTDAALVTGAEALEETGVAAEAGAQSQEQGDADPPEVDNAFYQRLQREKRKMEEEFAPLRQQQETLSRTAARFGLTPEQYVAELERQAIEEERETMRANGIDPDLVNQAVNNHPALRQAQQILEQQQAEARFQAEAQELFTMFPEVKPDQVPPEVFAMIKDARANGRQLTLLDAYLRYDYRHAQQRGEQEAVRKIKQGAAATPGALGSVAEQNTSSISKMSDAEFEGLQADVLAGRRKSL